MRLRVNIKVEYAEFEAHAVLMGDPVQVETVIEYAYDIIGSVQGSWIIKIRRKRENEDSKVCR